MGGERHHRGTGCGHPTGQSTGQQKNAQKKEMCKKQIMFAKRMHFLVCSYNKLVLLQKKHKWETQNILSCADMIVFGNTPFYQKKTFKIFQT